ncbi:MAG TPA: hypothetical protein VGE35_03470 [Candidatus Paceibacterota bacterium]
MNAISHPALSACTIALSADVVDRIERLMVLDFTRVRTFMTLRQKFNPEQVEKMELEYKRFLCLSIAFPDRAFPISNAVDDMWHVHILFTYEYHKASEIVGCNYLHHIPTPSEEERAALESEYFQGTLECYRQLFGEPPAAWWPKESAQICWSCGCQVGQCPRHLRTGAAQEEACTA